METIKYSDNRNGNLLCDSFADIRLPFPQYSIGTINRIELEHIGFLGYARIITAMPIMYKDITDLRAFPVCGKSGSYLKEMIKRFYDHIYDERPMVFFISQWTERNPETLLKLIEKRYDKLLSITPKPKASEYADGPHLD